MSATRRVLSFLGLNQSIAGMLVVVVFVGLGERLAERFVPVYLMALGASAIIPGLVNGLVNLLSALYSYPAGWISERFGYKRALAIFNLCSIFGYAIVLLVPHWGAVVVGSFFFLAWSALSLPATMSLVANVLPAHKRTMGVSMHSLVRRIPMALGPVIGGVLIDSLGVLDGIRAAFGLAIVLAIFALILQQKFVVESSPRTAHCEDPKLRQVIRGFSKNLRVLLASDILIRFCEQIPYAYMAVWAMNYSSGARISAKNFGVLTFIEMLVALLVYIPVAWLAEKGNKKNIVGITFLFFAIFPVVLLFSTGFGMLIVAFVVRGLKEFGEPTRKGLILDLAPADLRATTFGAYYLVRDVIVSAAAFASGWLWTVSPSCNFLVAAAFGFAGLFIFMMFFRESKERLTEVNC
jgi:MFS family permease